VVQSCGTSWFDHSLGKKIEKKSENSKNFMESLKEKKSSNFVV